MNREVIVQVRKFLNVEEIYRISKTNNCDELIRWVLEKKDELDDLEEKRKKDELYPRELKKATLSKYSEFLLKPRVTSANPILKEIFEEKNFDLLKNIFFPNCFKNILEENMSREDSFKKYKKCLYRLFILLSNGKFIEKDYSMRVLDWLAEIQIEKIIQEKDQVLMIHWLAMNNNLEGVKWAFNWYSKYLRDCDIEEIFQISDKHGENIFDYVTNGIIFAECSGLDPQPEIIELILKEFEKTIKNDQERILEVNRRKEQMSLSLQRKSLTCKSEMNFVTNNEFVVSDKNCFFYLSMFSNIKPGF